MSNAKSVMDFINTTIEAERRGDITYDEWCDIRRNGSPEEIAEAVERMEAVGGYDNLE